MKTARVRVSGVIEIADLGPPETYPLRYEFQYVNPEYRAELMRGIKHPLSKKHISLVRERPNGNVVLPRGTIREVRGTLSELGVLAKVVRDDRALAPWDDCPEIDPEALTLRDYQQEGVNAFARVSQGIITYPCGGGKTSTGIGCIAKVKQRTIVLVHTDDLLRQWIKAIKKTMGYDAGFVRGGKTPEWKDITLISIHKLRRMLENDHNETVRILSGYGLCILDECFPPGTKVGSKNIEELQVGDYVPSFCEKTKTIVNRKVLRLIKKITRNLVRLNFENGKTVTCTPDHLVYTTSGWCPAIECRGMAVYTTHHHEVSPHLPRVPEKFRCGPSREVLRRMQKTESCEEEKESKASLHRLRERSYSPGSSGARASSNRKSLLLQRAQARVSPKPEFGNDGKHEQKVRFPEDEKQQPHEKRRSESQSQLHLEGYGMGSCQKRRKRERCYHSPASTSLFPGVGVRSCSHDGRRVYPQPLQDRHCRRSLEDRDRGGRPLAQGEESSGCRQEERGIPSLSRVESVEVLEPGDRGEFERLCPQGVVYDLEIEDTHTYIANGAVVHNCHHAPARTFSHVLDYIPAYYRLGLTATPKREDGLTELMYWAFGSTLSIRTVDQLVERGFLTLPELTAIRTRLQFEYTGDDKKKNETIARAVYKNKERNQLIVRNAIQDMKDGLVTIIMTSRKNHAKLLAKELKTQGIEVPVLGGWSTQKVREDTIERMRKGEEKLIVAMPIFDEGVDVPALGAIHLSFPERAGGRLEQRAGRIMRPFEGKMPRLYDYVDDKVRAGTRVFDENGNYVETKWSDILKNRWDARRRIYKKLGIKVNLEDA